MSLWQEARPHVIQLGVEVLRGVLAGAVSGAPAISQPEVIEGRLVSSAEQERREHGGCPYCAADVHVWAALREVLVAHDSTDAAVRETFAERAREELARAFEAMDITEVIESEAGSKVLGEIIRASTTRGADYEAQARELYRIHEELGRLAGIRNGQA